MTLTSCGQVVATNTSYVNTAGFTIPYAFIFAGSFQDGDSGAPVWLNSPFGPLAQGIANASASGFVAGNLIDALQFSYGMQVNTVLNPS